MPDALGQEPLLPKSISPNFATLIWGDVEKYQGSDTFQSNAGFVTDANPWAVLFAVGIHIEPFQLVFVPDAAGVIGQFPGIGNVAESVLAGITFYEFHWAK